MWKYKALGDYQSTWELVRSNFNLLHVVLLRTLPSCSTTSLVLPIPACFMAKQTPRARVFYFFNVPCNLSWLPKPINQSAKQWGRWVIRWSLPYLRKSQYTQGFWEFLWEVVKEAVKRSYWLDEWMNKGRKEGRNIPECIFVELTRLKLPMPRWTPPSKSFLWGDFLRLSGSFMTILKQVLRQNHIETNIKWKIHPTNKMRMQ